MIDSLLFFIIIVVAANTGLTVLKPQFLRSEACRHCSHLDGCCAGHATENRLMDAGELSSAAGNPENAWLSIANGEPVDRLEYQGDTRASAMDLGGLKRHEIIDTTVAACRGQASRDSRAIHVAAN
jgi:hypothetical protein